MTGVANEVASIGNRAEAPRAAGVAGLVFAVLLVASLVMLRRHPGAGASAQEISDWYLGANASRVSVVGLYLAPFAGIAFLWFIAVIRHHVSALEDRFFDTALLGSGLLFVAMLFASAAAAGSLYAARVLRAARCPTVPGMGGSGQHRDPRRPGGRRRPAVSGLLEPAAGSGP